MSLNVFEDVSLRGSPNLLRDHSPCGDLPIRKIHSQRFRGGEVEE
jgi:hypothetical protein